MRIKPTSKTGGIVLELGPREAQIPEISAATLKLQKILVPVDFSDCSKKALQYAVAFARQFGAELHLLHVEEPYPVIADLGPVNLQDLQDARTELEALRLTIDDDIPSEVSVHTGIPHIEIAETARDLGIDLIIISTHGRKGLQRVFLGSTTEQLVRHAPCPVLIVRECEREFIPGIPSSAA